MHCSQGVALSLPPFPPFSGNPVSIQQLNAAFNYWLGLSLVPHSLLYPQLRGDGYSTGPLQFEHICHQNKNKQDPQHFKCVLCKLLDKCGAQMKCPPTRLRSRATRGRRRTGGIDTMHCSQGAALSLPPFPPFSCNPVSIQQLNAAFNYWLGLSLVPHSLLYPQLRGDNYSTGPLQFEHICHQNKNKQDPQHFKCVLCKLLDKCGAHKLPSTFKLINCRSLKFLEKHYLQIAK